jgi:uncharacterized protein (DUF2267 family)
MTHDEFIGQVQHRARLADGGAATHAVHAVLHVLGERLYGNEAAQLAAQLPPEIGTFLQEAPAQSAYSLRDFYQHVAALEGVELPAAIFHARAVVSVLVDAESPDEIADVRAQLPADFDALFQWPEGGAMAD